MQHFPGANNPMINIFAGPLQSLLIVITHDGLILIDNNLLFISHLFTFDMSVLIFFMFNLHFFQVVADDFFHVLFCSV
jgi:hypothetical protein